MALYRQLADELAARIRDGTLAIGKRVPSVRELRQGRGVSTATVLHAYERLEAQGYLEARPRSGFFVSPRWSQLPTEPATRQPPARTTGLAVSELVFGILEAIRDHEVVPLGSAFPSPGYFPLGVLARHLAASARHLDPGSTLACLPPGSLDLRRQIARRYLRFGARVAPDEIVITAGALEALNLSLQVLTRPGDLVAIESPAFYGCLQAIEARGLRAVEVPTHPRDGVDLAALARVLGRHPVRACWLMTTFQNPLGSRVPDGAKRELVRLLEQHQVPLIEDNVYAELHHGRDRPAQAKAFDRQGLVLDCGSFAKSLAPGYRLGWVAAGRFAPAVQRRQLMTSLSTSIPIQGAIARYLAEGGYDRFLKGLRRRLADGQAAALASLQRHLPAGYRVTRPEGGYFLWVELPAGVDAIRLHRQALQRGISVAPGPIFSARQAYGNCIRINHGHPWTRETEQAVATLGRLARAA